TRDQIDRVIEEQQLSSSGLVDEASAARIGVLVGAHEILSGRILQIDYSSPKTVSVELLEKSNITVEREDGEEDEELEVECIYSKLTKRSSLQIVASYSVIDVASGRIDTQQSFTASETFEKDWGRFISGDRRALSPQQKALISTAEPIAPTDKDMINSALTELSQGIVNHFCHYLK
ncbi:MAG: penicillin-binding protein activator LpoB, partial [Candidatus Cloacimonetes bacterium]|nr:penicillin-binding protein activator LpoB [Candidatus Cloacimonadota bacterium]